MDMSLSIISPTTGKDSLFALIESIIKQKNSIPIVHYLIWDDKREGKFINEMKPDDIGTDIKWGSGYIINNIVLKGKRIKGEALGSSLRAIGLISADSELVTFADDDITWEANHVETMLPMFQTSLWGFCKRRIWTTDNKIECLGVDNFESVGEDAKTPYKMVDNNCMMFRRELMTIEQEERQKEKEKKQNENKDE